MVKVSDFGELSPLEKEILSKAPTGQAAGARSLPRAGDVSKRVRAALLRALLLGKVEGVALHPKGADINGAWVDGDLDLAGCRLKRPVNLSHCRFGGAVVFRDAGVPALYLTGSSATHVDLHRLRCLGSVHLRDGFAVTAGVNLGSARIKGNLACDGGQFENTGGIALHCDAITVGASVFLRFGFKAVGEVNLVGARITGQLSCVGGEFENGGGLALAGNAMTVGASVFLRDGFKAVGDVNLVGARISGNLWVQAAEITGVFDLASARVDEGFFWRRVTGEVATLNLTDASVGVLRDDRASWAVVGKRKLKGFRFDRIDSDIRVQERIDLLAPSGDDVADFDPQPHSHLARVLTTHGQTAGAARVRFEREKHLRRAVYSRAKEIYDREKWKVGNTAYLQKWAADARFGVSSLFRLLFGYGHHPARALWVVAGVWCFASLLYGQVYAAGQMAPNSDVILTSQAWIDAVKFGCDPVKWAEVGWNSLQPVVAEGCRMPLEIWNDTAKSAPDYETFNARLYALDLFVPLDALGQETSWAPSKDRGWWGWAGYALRMPIQLAGWVITAVGAAVVTGLIGKKD